MRIIFSRPWLIYWELTIPFRVLLILDYAGNLGWDEILTTLNKDGVTSHGSIELLLSGICSTLSFLIHFTLAIGLFCWMRLSIHYVFNLFSGSACKNTVAANVVLERRQDHSSSAAKFASNISLWSSIDFESLGSSVLKFLSLFIILQVELNCVSLSNHTVVLVALARCRFHIFISSPWLNWRSGK